MEAQNDHGAGIGKRNKLAERHNADHAAGQGEEALKDITCGSMAGIVSKYIEYPFDTIKVRLQAQPDKVPLQYTGPLDCFKKSLKQDGFRGMYRGISAPLVGAAVENSCLFFTELPFFAFLYCGAASGTATSLVLTPIELVKCKMQVPLEAPNSTAPSPGVLSVVASVYRHQGLRGFWRGQYGTLIRETGGSAAWFGAFEGMKALFRRLRHTSPAAPGDEDLPLYQTMACGAVAGVSYNFLFFPADTVKSRMQTEDVRQVTGGKRSFAAVTTALWKQHGVRGLYRGCGITCARSAPSSAFIFGVYEELKRRWPA